MAENPFDRFDTASEAGPANPFDRFDAPPPAAAAAAAERTWGDTAKDVGQSIVSGLDRGVAGIAGLPADVASFIRWGGNHAQAALEGRSFPEVRDENASRAILKPETLEAWGGEAAHKASPLKHAPETTPGKFAESVSSFLPSALLGPGSVARNVALGAVTPGVASEAGGQLTAGTAAEPWVRGAAALAAPIAVSRAITPLKVDAARAPLVETLEREGVQLTAGQKSGSKPLQWAEATMGDMPGAGEVAAKAMERQGKQFNAAAARRMGEDADMLTPDVMKQASTRLGKEFDDLSARNTLTYDARMGQDLALAAQRYDKTLDALQKPLFENVLNDVRGKVIQGNGTIAGDVYQATRSDLSAIAAENAGNRYGKAIAEVRDALDNAMGRSISPADLVAWQKARNEYGAFKTVETAMSGAGEKTAQGFVSPAQLRSAVAGKNPGAYVRGDGELAELARAGAGVMLPLPNSGTAPRSFMMNMPSALAAGAGGAAGGIPGAVAGLLAPGLAGRALMSRPAQAYLGNQLIEVPAGLLSGESAYRGVQGYKDGQRAR